MASNRMLAENWNPVTLPSTATRSSGLTQRGGRWAVRIAWLSYRSKEHCGGQGVYVKHLSAGLADLGHEVEVFSGQPYPEGLDPRVKLTKLPSLDVFSRPDLKLPKVRE